MGTRSRRKRQEVADINITAFMNLMVVLVPFLLITAVFSQMSVLELNLPAGESPAQASAQKKPIVLELMVYKNRLEVTDRQTGPLKILPNIKEGHDFKGLSEYLERVKSQFSEITAITILLEQDTPYDVLIQAMDHVRQTRQEQEGNLVDVELFPDISIGTAPPDAALEGTQLPSTVMSPHSTARVGGAA